MSTEIQLITDLMETYFTALHQADPDLIRPIFHPDARYVDATQGFYRNLSVKEYLQVLVDRESPKSKGAQITGQIERIDIDPGGMAFIRANMQMLNRHYTDYLTLTKSEGTWLIQSKIFVWETL
ncbi:nuclear transport factor 2 family protein [Sneathiella limimaris]|uniref:nuclear transport factor 2 family protein n=1 Tax=Sneathiella limimaris TaxID=1964213 RepID=UPI001469F4A9|nr:nuclear transport factor 2 family protein [Sneathiella limimaris]